MTQHEAMLLVKDATSLPHLVRLLREHGSDGVFDEWAIRYFLDVRARERGVPFKGTFEITPLCNLDCKMCYVHLNKEQLCGQSLLPAEQWEQIMQEAIDAGLMYAALTGGECLTSPDFDRLYLFLHSKGVQVSILTNGVLLDEKRIRFFQEHPPKSIQITLYGDCEDTYERVTGHRHFERVMRHIRMADEAKLPIRLAVTPNAYLGKADEALVRCAVETGLQVRINSELMTPLDNTGRSDNFKDLTPETYMRLFKLYRELRGQDVPVECEPDIAPMPAATDGEPPRGLLCGGGRSSFTITWDGCMTPCSGLHWIRRPVGPGEFKEHWQFINQTANNYPRPQECESCPCRNAARTCAASHKAAPAGHADPEQCKWCHAMIKAGFAKLAD